MDWILEQMMELDGGINDWRTRIFVSGCGIKKVEDLIQNGEKTA